MQLDVVFVDNHLLVINKSAGLLSQADATGDPDALSLGRAYIKRKYAKPGKVWLGLVHRLDRPASGLMVLARTSKGAARLSSAFREHRITKSYIALVQGTLEGSGVCRDRLVKQGRRVHIVDENDPSGKLAELDWQAVTSSQNATLVRVGLKTGRPHQIRVQLSNLGHPILGDMKYGATTSFEGRNIALHCQTLGFEHPVRRVPQLWRSQPASTWQEYVPDANLASLAPAEFE